MAHALQCVQLVSLPTAPFVGCVRLLVSRAPVLQVQIVLSVRKTSSLKMAFVRPIVRSAPIQPLHHVAHAHTPHALPAVTQSRPIA